MATSYLFDGSTIIAQKTGDDILWFLYDSDGTNPSPSQYSVLIRSLRLPQNRNSALVNGSR
nr:hypothetical protein [Proteiniphilum sp. UBA5510]